MSATTTSDDSRLTVFYDGGCPLCRREIAFYGRLDRDRKIRWKDVAGSQGELRSCGLTRREALAVIHARKPDGDLARGAEAFVEIWRRLPWFRRVAPLAAWPPALWFLERGYRGFLKIRPWLTGRRPLEG
jgi:predicted DCC family thiol-disulfide oxidoreductase YuxK